MMLSSSSTKTAGGFLKRAGLFSLPSFSLPSLTIACSIPQSVKTPISFSSSNAVFKAYSSSTLHNSQTAGKAAKKEVPLSNWKGYVVLGKPIQRKDPKVELAAFLADPISYANRSLRFQNFLLGRAAYHDEEDVLKILLSHPFIADPRSCSLIAVYNGNKDRKSARCFELLLNDPRTDIESSIEFITKIAIEDNELEFVKAIISAPRSRALLETMGEKNYPFAIAARNGRLECLKMLLKLPGLDPSRFDNMALRMAAGHGYADCLSLLISEPRCDPSSFENSAIRVASKNGHIQCVRLLIKDRRVDASDWQNGAIYSATRKEIFRLLLRNRKVYEKFVSHSKAFLSDKRRLKLKYHRGSAYFGDDKSW